MELILFLSVICYNLKKAGGIFMLILSLECTNLFMFNKFKIDFTYEKKLNHFLSANDAIFPNSKIYVRKNMIILGGNASGKTTFGRLLCAINNYIIGREISDKLNLYKAIYDKEKKASFKIEFVIDNMVYCVFSEFDIYGIKYEYLKEHKIYKTYNISKLRDELTNSKEVISYKRETFVKDENSDLISKPFCSKMLRDPNHEKKLNKIKQGMGFHYWFSSFTEQSEHSKIEVSVDMINKILPKIDNSIEKVVALTGKDEDIETNSYVIVFKNKEQTTIPDGDLLRVQSDRLSHGTYEVLSFLNMIEEIRKRKKSIIFIDEKMAHLHAELEVYLIMKAFVRNTDNQIFVTSHNSELLELNVPNNAFVLFKRCTNGYNSSLFVSDKLNKNDRNIRNYYENDYFNVLPDYSMLDDYFEE